MPEFDKLVATKGYKDRPIEEWPGSPVGMEEIAAACGDPRDWFHPYHRLNEAASMPGGSGPLDLSLNFALDLWPGASRSCLEGSRGRSLYERGESDWCAPDPVPPAPLALVGSSTYARTTGNTSVIHGATTVP